MDYLSDLAYVWILSTLLGGVLTPRDASENRVVCTYHSARDLAGRYNTSRPRLAGLTKQTFLPPPR